MDCNRNCIPHSSVVFLSFLKQKGCQNDQLKIELEHLDEQLNRHHTETDEDLEIDGHGISVNYRELLHSLQQEIQPQLPADAEEAQAAREMAAELIIIADLLEHQVLFRAADRLTKKLDESHKQSWGRLVSDGVQTLLQQAGGAREFKQELVEMAFTFVLMKAVCEHVPRLLFPLYSTVVRYFRSH